MPGVPPARYAYLGPEGTFTEMALRSLPAAEKADRQPFATVPMALESVREGSSDGAVVPMENSVEGAVSVTLDELAAGDPLVITREMTVPVRFALLARSGTPVEKIQRVVTHPHAAAQCRRWLAFNLPRAEIVHGPSTAGAAAMVADPDSPYDAAIAAPIAGDRYRLARLADNIGDNPDAVTRFVLVTRPGAPLPPTGADKTSVVVYIFEDHAGALLEVLEQFSARGVNLSRIESRPTGLGLGRYCFWIDAEGHVADARMGEALTGLRRTCADVRFLGSYPRADGQAPQLRRGTTDRDYRSAGEWLARLREGR